MSILVKKIKCVCGGLITGNEKCNMCNTKIDNRCYQCHNNTAQHQRNRTLNRYRLPRELGIYSFLLAFIVPSIIGIGVKVVGS